LSYSSTRRSFIHCARRTLLNPRTGPETRCDNGQKGQTNLVPCAFGILSTITAQPDRHNRYWICGAGTSFEAIFTAGFVARRGTAFRARVARRGVRLAARLVVRLDARRVDRVAVIE